jgi:sugar phosphate isomerase/epimerase
MNTTRRQFLVRSMQGAAAALVPALLPGRAFGAGAADKPIGIQVYAVNQPFLEDPAGTFKKLREIGFTEVECYAAGKASAKEYRRMLDDAGLVCPSTHLDFEPAKLEAAFADAHALGARYAASSSLRSALEPKVAWEADFTLEEAKRTAELANRIGEAAKRAGLQYAYHNHDYEFADLGDGTSGYDFLLRETDAGLVKFEIDCGWMAFAGRSPADYLARHPGRVPMLHIKDYLAAGDASAKGDRPAMAGAELGRGTVDYRPIFAAAKKAGVRHFFAEQEGPFSRMNQLDAAKVAYEFLRSMP